MAISAPGARVPVGGRAPMARRVAAPGATAPLPGGPPPAPASPYGAMRSAGAVPFRSRAVERAIPPPHARSHPGRPGAGPVPPAAMGPMASAMGGVAGAPPPGGALAAQSEALEALRAQYGGPPPTVGTTPFPHRPPEAIEEAFAARYRR